MEPHYVAHPNSGLGRERAHERAALKAQRPEPRPAPVSTNFAVALNQLRERVDDVITSYAQDEMIRYGSEGYAQMQRAVRSAFVTQLLHANVADVMSFSLPTDWESVQRRLDKKAIETRICDYFSQHQGPEAAQQVQPQASIIAALLVSAANRFISERTAAQDVGV